MLVVASIVVACGTSSAPTAPPSPSPSPSSSASPPVPSSAPSTASMSAPVDAGADATRVDAEPPSPAWTDAVHVDGLARDCAYAPKDIARPKNVERDFWEGSPLACGYGLYGQSCAVDPCYDEQKDVCGVKCERTCDGCATGCQSACKACKTACKKGDDGCARACATSCATCRQECVLAKDRCSTGTCAKRYEQCKVELQTKWDKGGCGKACRAYYDCSNACPEGEGSFGQPCAKKCEPKLAPCTGTFRSACLFNGGLYAPPGAD